MGYFPATGSLKAIARLKQELAKHEAAAAKVIWGAANLCQGILCATDTTWRQSACVLCADHGSEGDGDGGTELHIDERGEILECVIQMGTRLMWIW